MAKLESTFKNMVLSLTLIALVAAGLLAGVYMLTQYRIAEQARAKQEAARLAVLNGQEGQAIEVSENGFGGIFKVMVGLAPDGTILGYQVLEHQETPGLGSHMEEWFQDASKPAQNIIGRKAGALRVSKDGGDVDAITAATISSRAFLKAVNNAYSEAFHTDAYSGASILQQQDSTIVTEPVNAEDSLTNIE